MNLCLSKNAPKIQTRPQIYYPNILKTQCQQCNAMPWLILSGTENYWLFFTYFCLWLIVIDFEWECKLLIIWRRRKVLVCLWLIGKLGWNFFNLSFDLFHTLINTFHKIALKGVCTIWNHWFSEIPKWPTEFKNKM